MMKMIMMMMIFDMRMTMINMVMMMTMIIDMMMTMMMTMVKTMTMMIANKTMYFLHLCQPGGRSTCCPVICGLVSQDRTVPRGRLPAAGRSLAGAIWHQLARQGN